MSKSDSIIDLCIVGGGLAGLTLAYRAVKENLNIILLDHPFEGTASKVSGGVMNPITGKRYVKTWQWDLLKDHFEILYKELEETLCESFFHEIQIIQSLENPEQENQWIARCGQDEYAQLISWASSVEQLPIQNERLSFGIIHRAYQLEIDKLLTLLTDFLKAKNVVHTERVRHQEMEFKENKWTYKGIAPRLGFVFAEGYKVSENPFFQELPHFAVKGQRSIVEGQLKFEGIYKSSYSLCKINGNRFWCGSNYEFQNRDCSINESEKAQKKKFLEKLLGTENSILQELVGIRPAMKDRRPAIGTHKIYSDIHLFNGMGTKGSSLIPYCIHVFLSFLLKNEPIPKEINLNRFYL